MVSIYLGTEQIWHGRLDTQPGKLSWLWRRYPVKLRTHLYDAFDLLNTSTYEVICLGVSVDETRLLTMIKVQS